MSTTIVGIWTGCMLIFISGMFIFHKIYSRDYHRNKTHSPLETELTFTYGNDILWNRKTDLNFQYFARAFLDFQTETTKYKYKNLVAELTNQIGASNHVADALQWFVEMEHSRSDSDSGTETCTLNNVAVLDELSEHFGLTKLQNINNTEKMFVTRDEYIGDILATFIIDVGLLNCVVGTLPNGVRFLWQDMCLNVTKMYKKNLFFANKETLESYDWVKLPFINQQPEERENHTLEGFIAEVAKFTFGKNTQLTAIEPQDKAAIMTWITMKTLQRKPIPREINLLTPTTQYVYFNPYFYKTSLAKRIFG